MSTLKENVHDLFDGWNTIPNWLSFIRIALIPVFAVLFVFKYLNFFCESVLGLLCCLFRDINWWQ